MRLPDFVSDPSTKVVCDITDNLLCSSNPEDIIEVFLIQLGNVSPSFTELVLNCCYAGF